MNNFLKHLEHEEKFILRTHMYFKVLTFLNNFVNLWLQEC